MKGETHVWQNMSAPRLLVLLLLGLLIAPAVSATDGRAAPQCAQFDLSDIISSGSGVAVETGACLIIDIGVRNSATTLAIDYEVMDDAMVFFYSMKIIFRHTTMVKIIVIHSRLKAHSNLC